ncbi:hypothetical protein [Kitasatospora sp. NPDC054795]
MTSMQVIAAHELSSRRPIWFDGRDSHAIKQGKESHIRAIKHSIF